MFTIKDLRQAIQKIDDDFEVIIERPDDITGRRDKRYLNVHGIENDFGDEYIVILTD